MHWANKKDTDSEYSCRNLVPWPLCALLVSYSVFTLSFLLQKCALQPVPFKPSKLTVQRFPGTRQSGLCPQHPRRYTLTHNDLTGQLLLTIGHQYNKNQLSGWYNRLLRDEILAYWQFGSDKPVLHIECHVSGEETWLGPPILRDYIFRREMPLVRVHCFDQQAKC